MTTRSAVGGVAAAAVIGLLAAGEAGAATRRERHHDLLFGLGSLTSQDATIFGPVSLDADDGTTFGIRYRYHFNENIGIEVDLTGETDTTDLKDGSFTVDSVDTDTGFFLVNVLFNLTATPVSPYVTVGFGSYEHEARGILFPDGSGSFFIADIEESGGVVDAALGLDGRTEGRLIWAFEARLLHYEFDGFSDDWNRIQFSGHIGFHF